MCENVHSVHGVGYMCLSIELSMTRNLYIAYCGVYIVCAMHDTEYVGIACCLCYA